MKILIADDEEGSRQMLAGFLSKRGHEVLQAMNGEEALDMALTEQPEILLLDWVMPHKSGLEVLESLKKQGTNPPKVFMTTGKDQPQEITAMKAAGADEILIKPYDLVGLLGHIEKIKNNA